MIHKIEDYINTLRSSEISVSDLDKAKEILDSSEELVQILNSPSVSHEEKKNVVNELFPSVLKSFITTLAEDCNIDSLSKIINEYTIMMDKKNRVASATIYCVTEPDESQLKGIEEFVCKEENAGSAKLEIVKDESLIGGFIKS